MDHQEPSSRNRTSSCGCSGGCGGVDRREFLKVSSLGAASLAAWMGMSEIAGPFEPRDTIDHFVPADKKLSPKWIELLTAKGQPDWYQGQDLAMAAMPVGGICTGQLYLAGDGRLTHWDIFNGTSSTGRAGTHYQRLPNPIAALKQGFAIRVRTQDATSVRTLDRQGFPDVQFRGEYPIGTVKYKAADLPVEVTLEAYSPFIPLSAADSALPATVMQFTVKNTSSSPATVALGGWLENGVCCHSGESIPGKRMNRVVRGDKMTMVLGSARPSDEPATKPRPVIALADFEGDDYGKWTAEGEAFGTGPARGTLRGQQKVSGFQGRGLVNTFLQGDKTTGKLTSPAFAVERSFINFLVGGGSQAGKTCINLLVKGKVVRTATGQGREQLAWHSWNVQEFAGQQAQIQIVDDATGPWGHINVDQIELSDQPRLEFQGTLDQQRDFGTMGLAVLGDGAQVTAIADLPDSAMAAMLGGEQSLSAVQEAEKPVRQSLCGALSKTVSVPAGGQAQVTFVVAWCFPHLPKNGNFYGTRFRDAQAVAAYVAENFGRLSGQTHLWRDTWYDSSLPSWLLDRLFAPVSILATSTCQWWANGRFWAWEGVRCCAGTCAHVWNYAHSMARLFPELERSARELQDFGAGFVEETGAVNFRGESNKMWAGDSQGGTVLKTYREHQMSADDGFLKRVWPRVRKAVEFLLEQDGNADGLIEGSQHNTYDINFFGPNTMVGSLYLGALRAAEEMATEMGDAQFAARCRKVFEAGSKNSVAQLFNGEYFIQKVDLKEHPKHQYADGCLADQMFGQGWARQLALGLLYPQETVLATLRSVWKYDWAPDIGPQNEAHPPQRWFARPGEAGLFTCTWPKSKHLGPDSVLYRDEIWTGIEYQVAGHMAWEGMVTESLAVCRAVHERYHPIKQNPWNEVECGDHYSRAMASHGVFLGLCGWEYHGPKGHVGFVPRLSPEAFRASFTAAEGWGTIQQKRADASQTQRIQVRWGRLRVASLAFELPAGKKLGQSKLTVGDKPIAATAKQAGARVEITLQQPLVLGTGETLDVVLTC